MQPITTAFPLSNRILLQALVMKALREALEERGFVETFYQEVTEVTGSCETIANIFILAEKNLMPLRQTAQLLMEELLVSSNLPRMFTSGRSFRREVATDGRHLSEFELFEWEALDIDLQKLVEYNAEIVEHVIVRVLRSNLLERERHRALYHWFGKWKENAQDHVISYSNAIQFLRDIAFTVIVETESGQKFERPIEYGDDLNSKAERALTQHFGILQVTHYPEPIKFFNMERSRDFENEGCVECVDLLLPYAGETIGGSAREYDYAILSEKLRNSLMLKHLLDLNRQHGGTDEEVVRAFDSYLNLFKHNPYPRAGAGLGLGRLFQFLIASPSIIPF
ncbi:MAG: hypothetical protein HYT22_03830 [Candidatus Niyogibacteria bacterium]|nr:hypothetical protein [Candidatus Niyogibacteria bacterium]